MADAPHWISSRFVDGGWGAPSFAATATAPLLETLTQRWTRLEPHVRLGLCLALPFMRPGVANAEAAALASAAVEDDEEWVRVMGRAAGAAPGRLDTDAVLAEAPKAREAASAAEG